MSLIKFIQKLQNKPRHVRVQILWLSVFVSMAIIISLWVISLDNSLPSSKENETDPLSEVKEQLPSLIEVFKASVSSFFGKDIEIAPASVNTVILNDIGNIKPGKLPVSKNINE